MKKGKVFLCTIDNRSYVLPDIDKQLFAVGKPKGKTYFQYWQHAPGLAPSPALVTSTNITRRTHGDYTDWFTTYREELLKEWYNRRDFLRAYSELINDLDNGKNIAIACYCPPQRRLLCHLSILQELLIDMGYKVLELKE